MSRKWSYLMLAGSAFFWSGNYIIGRAFASDIPPITISYLRWSVAFMLILPFSASAVIAEWPIIRKNIKLLIFMGIVGVSAFNTFAYIGLSETTATNALLINSFIPILIILLTRIFPGTPISAQKLIGILISTAGVLLLISQGNLENLIAFKLNKGDLWVLLAALTWAVYSISLAWKPAGLSALAFLGFTMFVGLLVLSPIYWLNLFQEPSFVASPSNLMAIAYVAIFASIVAFLFWNHGVSVVGARTAGQFIHLMPVFGTTMAVMLLGEHLYWFHFLGAVAIGWGILLSLRAA